MAEIQPEIVPIPALADDVTTQTPAVELTGNPSLIPSQPKKFYLLNFLSSKPKISKSKSLPVSSNLPTEGKTAAEHLALSNLIDQDLFYITETCKKLDTYKGHVSEEAIRARKQLESLKIGGNPGELRKLKRTVTKLKFHISSKYKDRADDQHRKKRANDSEKLKQISEDELLKIMSQFYDSQVLKGSSQFLDFLKVYNDLRVELKLCLLCFALFPEDAVIKKRFMIYWWMGERFVPPIDESEKTAEEIGNEFFLELIEKGFIEPVFKKRNLMADSCKMHPFIRSILVQLAIRAKFFDFNENGSPTEQFSNSFRACLVGEGLVNQQELEKLHMLFNVNEEILDFKAEWFLKMRNINLISLGRWQTSPTHHIELEEVDFLDGLSVMNHLRFLSLQGVSRIMELPDSISHLINLTILDLRACHNLEVIPKEIGKLRSLTHLDMSDCYLIDHMPKELALLSQLQVLKGFLVVFSDKKSSCNLRDLSKLQNLRKLSIYTGLQKFPSEADLRALQEFESLRKLTIAWGGGATSNGKASGNVPKKDKKLRDRKSLLRQTAFKSALESLEKLDLQCFPGKDANWLTPSKLKGLKKLYIRGGNLRDLGQYIDFETGDDFPAMESWNVEILRVKYLSELEMDWGELHELFPDLVYLEKVNCPKLTLFPCDESGVWMNKAKSKDARS